jgi:hypothetical protein
MSLLSKRNKNLLLGSTLDENTNDEINKLCFAFVCTKNKWEYAVTLV